MASMQHPSKGSHPVAEAGTLEFRVAESQVDFDIRFYDAILQRNHDNVDVLRQLVELLAREGQSAKALELDQRLVSLRPKDQFARYNLACTLAILGQLGPALKALEEAFRLGYDDVAHMEADADLDAVRQHPGYFRLLKKLGIAI